MNRNRNAGFGAALLALLMFRVGGTTTPTTKETTNATVSSLNDLGHRTTGEGPWIASCAYWAPDRPVSTLEDEDTRDGVSVELNDTHDKITGMLTGEEYDQSRCNGAHSDNQEDSRWGIPTAMIAAYDKTGKSVESVTAPTDQKPVSICKASSPIASIIAIVPDPLQTNMAFMFDREIDSLIEAASEKHFQSSYYWLPWPATETNTPMREQIATNHEKSEREPGLILFRSVSTDQKQACKDPPSTLYVFLVGETPTTGIDGEKMQKALRYRHDLAQLTGYHEDHLSVIGPNFSGSAASLHRVISYEEKTNDDERIVVRGTTSTTYASEVLNGSPQHPDSLTCGETGRTVVTASGVLQPAPSEKVNYQSFNANGIYDADQLNCMLTESGVKPERIALLEEDVTTAGQKAVEATPRQWISVRFPRDIYLLRNAYSERLRAAHVDDTSPPSPTCIFRSRGRTHMMTSRTSIGK
jgi:hypothetical protein